MVNTLRIASVAAVILAGLVLASVMGFASIRTLDAGKDEELTRILDAPSVVDKFQESQGDKEQDREDAISPLVKEAEIFALYLNPPPPPIPQTPKPNLGNRGGRPIPPPPPTSAKFDLLGTSYSAASQSECFAFIKMQDGKTFRWVRTGDVIGHTQIKEIRRDSIICSDGTGDTPMFVPQRQDTSSLLETGADSVVARAPATLPSAGDRITGPSASDPAATSTVIANKPKAPLLPATSEADKAALGRLVSQIKESAGQRAAVNKMVEEFRAARERAEEANAVENPGNEPNVSPNISPLRGRPGIRRRLGAAR